MSPTPFQDDEAARDRPAVRLSRLDTSDRSRLPETRDGYVSQDASPTLAQMAANLPGFTSYWDPSYNASMADGATPATPLDAFALQSASPLESSRDRRVEERFLSTPDPFDNHHAYVEDAPASDYADSDRVPLTSGAQPMSGSLAMGNRTPEPRSSFQTVSDLGNSPRRGRETRSLGQDIERGLGSNFRRSQPMALTPSDYRSTYTPSSSGALLRAGSIVRAMSQRVVNLSGEGEMADRRTSRHRSRSPRPSSHSPGGDQATPMFVDTSYPSQMPNPTEKGGSELYVLPEQQPLALPPRRMPNPFKGPSLGIFGPDNPTRLWLCDLLVKPYTEPVILLLIVAQTVLLAVESSPNVFTEGNGRPERWGQQATDWAILGLFIVFTLELIARIIVSGFILNAADYSTIDRKKGLRAAIAGQYKNIFQPQRQKSIRASRQQPSNTPVFVRSFTNFMQGQPRDLPETFEDQQRFQLARRAFLRHSFNRLDFVAVVAFWIDFVLGITGLESRHHLYVFKMLSCLRILRLLALTHGTSVHNSLYTVNVAEC